MWQSLLLTLLELDANSKWQVMGPNMHHSLFSISHLCMYLHTKLENFRSDVQHIKWLLYCQRHSLCGLDLHKRSDWRATCMAPKTYRSFSDTTLCAYTASPCIQHCYLVCNYACKQNSRTLWLHTTHQMTASPPMMHCIIWTKLASYTTHCSDSSINRVNANIKITKRYYHIYVLFYEFAAKQQKRIIN